MKTFHGIANFYSMYIFPVCIIAIGNSGYKIWPCYPLMDTTPPKVVFACYVRQANPIIRPYDGTKLSAILDNLRNSGFIIPSWQFLFSRKYNIASVSEIVTVNVKDNLEQLILGVVVLDPINYLPFNWWHSKLPFAHWSIPVTHIAINMRYNL